MTSGPHSRRSAPAGTRFVAALLLGVVLVGFLELGGRLWYLARTGEAWHSPRLEVTRPPDLDRGVVADEDNALQFITFDPARLVRLVPYSGDRVHINRLGFRGPEIEAEKPLNTCRIAMLGGSTTYGWGASGDATTIPAQLERMLHEESGHRVQMINAGVPGYTSNQDLLQLQSQVLPLRPDVVVLYTGINDAKFAAWADWEPHMSDWSREIERLVWIGTWTSSLGLGWAAAMDAGTYLANNSYLAFATRSFVRQVLGVDRSRPVIADPERPAEERWASLPHREAIQIFARNLQDMVLLAQAHGAKVLLAFPPTEPTVGLPRERGPEREQRVAQLEGRSRALAEAEEALWRVARRMAVPVTALNDALAPRPAQYLIDLVHLNDRGNAAVARRLAATIRDLQLCQGAAT